MIRSLYIAKTGLQAQQTRLDVIANNLANVSTTGFKRSRVEFEDLLYQNLRQPGAMSSVQTTLPTGLQIGAGVQAVATERLHTQGNIEKTGNSKDMAIQGRGFFMVRMPDGNTAYTRDGSFHLNQNGRLVTSAGYPVMPPIMVPSNALSLTVARDGTVSVTQPGSNGSVEIGQVQLATFVNPAGLESVGANLYRETNASGPQNNAIPGLNGAGILLHKYIETSNVQVVTAMVNMIATQRAYEINAKAIDTSDQMLARLAQL